MTGDGGGSTTTFYLRNNMILCWPLITSIQRINLTFLQCDKIHLKQFFNALRMYSFLNSNILSFSTFSEPSRHDRVKFWTTFGSEEWMHSYGGLTIVVDRTRWKRYSVGEGATFAVRSDAVQAVQASPVGVPCDTRPEVSGPRSAHERGLEPFSKV